MANVIDVLATVFAKQGHHEYLGEAVTMSQHMLLTAGEAEEAGADDHLIAAALLHDVGHFKNLIPSEALMRGQDNFHEEAGAAFLADYFPQSVVEPVRQHVAAKRYLCAVDSAYFGLLSEASKYTLNLQGGPMNQSEIDAFESLAHLEGCVQLRLWDDAGKDPEQRHRQFGDYRALLERLVIA